MVCSQRHERMESRKKARRGEARSLRAEMRTNRRAIHESKDKKETATTSAKPTGTGAFSTTATGAAATHSSTPCRKAMEQDLAPPCRAWSNVARSRGKRWQWEDGVCGHL